MNLKRESKELEIIIYYEERPIICKDIGESVTIAPSTVSRRLNITPA